VGLVALGSGKATLDAEDYTLSIRTQFLIGLGGAAPQIAYPLHLDVCQQPSLPYGAGGASCWPKGD
jgi:hypothetical protein